VTTLTVLGAAARLSVAEFFGFWSPRTYAVVWVPRLVFQTAFFALLGTFAGGPALLRFALVGNAAYLTCQAILTVATASMQWELGAGTVPLLVASPANPLVVFIGRNLAVGGHGVLSGLVTLLIANLLGVELSPASWLAAALILCLIAASSYGLASLLGSLVLRFTGYRNAASSLVGFTLLAISGVNVPLDVLPDWVQTVALSIPLAHGLLALRGVLAGAPALDVLTQVGAEAALGVTYTVAAYVSLRVFIDSARRAGTFDFH
jgi:ABC-2 type transport system permease protein